MRLTRPRLVALSATLMMTACGIDLVGTGTALDGGAAEAQVPDGMAADGQIPDGSPADVVTADEGSTDAGVDAAEAEAPDACASSCPALDAIADAGGTFQPVAFTSSTTPCPAGFATATGIQTPSAPAAACTCGNCTVNGAACGTGNLQFEHSNDLKCDQDGSNVPMDTCRGQLTFSTNNFGAYPPGPTNQGTCSLSSVPHRDLVPTTLQRTCIPPTTCGEQLCGLGSAFKVCLLAAGDQACPASAPNKISGGSDFTLGCGACGCSTQVTCGGTLSLYNGGNCSGNSTDLPANTCQPGNINNNSYKFTSAMSTQCTNVTPGKPTIAMLEAGTICCP